MNTDIVLGENFFVNLLHQLPGLIVVVDKESRFIYSNKYTANLFGYHDEECMHGIDAHAMKCPAVECAQEFIAQDQLVMQTGEEITILDIHQYAYGKPKILLTKKTPFIENQQIRGSICHCTEIHSITLSQVCSALIQADKKYYTKKSAGERSYTFGHNINNKQLSERELDCMFYLLRGHTIKQIGQLLGISPRIVETYMEKTRIKLNCSKKADIVEYCLSEGLLNYIPQNFLEINISNIIHQNVKVIQE